MASYPPQINQAKSVPQSPSPPSPVTKYRIIFLLSLVFILLNALVYYLVYKYSPSRLTAWHEMAKNENITSEKITGAINYVLKGTIVEISRKKLVIESQGKEQTFLPDVTYLAEYAVTSPLSNIEEWPLKVIENNNISSFHKGDEVFVLIRGRQLTKVSPASFIVYKVIKQEDKLPDQL